MKIITGYKGVNDIFLAAEQGEVHGATVNFSSLLGKPDWMAAGKARILIQFGTERLPGIKDVPTAIELANDEAGRQMLRVYATNGFVSVALNLLVGLALGHPLGWVPSVVIGAVVGICLTWSYLRRCQVSQRAGRR